MPDGPFEEVVIVDVRMVGNQYHTRASLYRRYPMSNEMEFMRKGVEYGPFDAVKPAVRSAALGISQRRIARLFIEATPDVKERLNA